MRGAGHPASQLRGIGKCGVLVMDNAGLAFALSRPGLRVEKDG